MLKIQVDLQEEYNILVCARHTANLRRKAKEGQHCFVQQDVKCSDWLEYLTWQLQTKAHAEKQKALVLLKVLALSQKVQDYYYEQKNHYQTIADAYTEWYACQQTLARNSNCT